MWRPSTRASDAVTPRISSAPSSTAGWPISSTWPTAAMTNPTHLPSMLPPPSETNSRGGVRTTVELRRAASPPHSSPLTCSQTTQALSRSTRIISLESSSTLCMLQSCAHTYRIWALPSGDVTAARPTACRDARPHFLGRHGARAMVARGVRRESASGILLRLTLWLRHAATAVPGRATTCHI